MGNYVNQRARWREGEGEGEGHNTASLVGSAVPVPRHTGRVQAGGCRPSDSTLKLG